MGNIICFNGNDSADNWINMSNGLTDVFINVLALSGSELAETVHEKQLVVWLSEKDQKIGRGTVGFDVVDMPWHKDTFIYDKAFMLKVIEAAQNKLSWEKLDYEPNEKLLMPTLKKFKEYIDRMSEKDINENALNEWICSAGKDDPINCGFPRCKKHNTLLTFLGCQICNN